MDVKVLGQYSIYNYHSMIYPGKVCLSCPFFHDGPIGWCWWYREKVNNVEFNEKCKVKKIEVEEE